MNEMPLPKPPRAYEEFVDTLPELAAAWDCMAAAGEAGPLDARTRRLDSSPAEHD